MTRPPENQAAPPTVLPVRVVEPARPLRWLAAGWHDCVRTPGPSLLHGLLVALGGMVVLSLAWGRAYVLAGAFSGFVLVGPILATGLYELSRLLGRGERPTLANVVDAWRRGTPPLVVLGLLLMFAATMWVAVSAALFALVLPGGIDGPRALLAYAARPESDLPLLVWLLFGGLGAAIVFAMTAISPPLLMGRQVGLRCALLTSVRAVGENPVPMLIWALFIIVATVVSIATLMLGFIVAVPVLGHATWHAYRDLVDTSAAALRY